MFSTEGPRENVWRPRENVAPGSEVALNGPGGLSLCNVAYCFRKAAVRVFEKHDLQRKKIFKNKF